MDFQFVYLILNIAAKELTEITAGYTNRSHKPRGDITKMEELGGKWFK